MFNDYKCLSASAIAGTIEAMQPVDELADRIWLAWHALPRDERGRPPSFASVEQSKEISNGTLQKICSGKRLGIEAATLSKIAQALGVSADWLLTGAGEPPRPTGHVTDRHREYNLPRPEGERVRIQEALDAVAVLARLDGATEAAIEHEVTSRAYKDTEEFKWRTVYDRIMRASDRVRGGKKLELLAHSKPLTADDVDEAPRAKRAKGGKR